MSLIEAQFDKVFDTQQIYRLTLDAMARPGKVNSLPALRLKPPDGLNWGAAAIALTLFDSEAGFCSLSAGQAAGNYLTLNTGAALRPVATAEFVIAGGEQPLPELGEASCGTLLSPELGATLLIMVKQLSPTGGEIKLQLAGPGIKGSSLLFISGLAPENLATVAQLNREFPLGVDVIYIDDAGHIACVPRSSSLQWEVVS